MAISVFNPVSQEAGDLLWLWDVCMWVCGFIMLVVTGSLAYMMIRFRRRGDEEPDQRTGNKVLEITWTAVPVALVTFLFVVSVLTAEAVDKPVHRDPDLIVVGHQWWWEIRYPAVDAITANEIHIPTGRDLLVEVDAADVIHDFWVPQLSRKMDAIPGKKNFIWMSAARAGTYAGVCAEFCGPQHAWMRFRVIADDPPTYQRWLAAQAAPAQHPPGGDAQAGEKRFGELTCANCHNIKGQNRQKQYAPDLTHLASRQMLAGERLKNDERSLRDWLHEPNIIKPNCNMPSLNLSEQDLTRLTAYLETLK